MISQNIDDSNKLADETICILTTIIQVTELLNQAISDRDTNRIQELLVTRESLCVDAGYSFRWLNMLTDDSSYAPENISSQLESAFEEIRLLSDKILQSQKECGNLLESKINECRSELSAIHRKADLRQAYSTVTKNRIASFIDSAI